jgi:hypothetical protein
MFLYFFCRDYTQLQATPLRHFRKIFARKNAHILHDSINAE